MSAAMREDAKPTSEHRKPQNYQDWSTEQLIDKVTQLELQLRLQTESYQSISVRPLLTKPSSASIQPQNRVHRDFDASKYSSRLIALKFAYLGKDYNGYECHNNKTVDPTIEEELWRALTKSRLIFPTPVEGVPEGDVNWEGCEYSKCGRTDKGVSAFGQVIGIRVRSNRPMDKNSGVAEAVAESGTVPSVGAENSGGAKKKDQGEGETDEIPFDDIADEIQYITVLNRLLPSAIRILAWCPNPPADFSARFSCQARHYRYFFTQPCFLPTPTSLTQQQAGRPSTTDKAPLNNGWLDIEAMRRAAKLYEGLHDFRNLCKIDASKQISNFERRIYYSDIEEVNDTTDTLSFLSSLDTTSSLAAGDPIPKVYTFTLHGSAFLWHQVRCMVAILFLVGQGLEDASIVTKLLDVNATPSRPTYEMASDTPLVLWNCIFPGDDDPDADGALKWVYAGDAAGQGEAKYSSGRGVMDDLWSMWRERKMDEMLAATLMQVVGKQGKPAGELSASKAARSQRLFDGSSRPRPVGVYQSVMKRPRMEAAGVLNERYALRKGFANSAEMKVLGFRRLNEKGNVSLEESDGLE